jgi:hypothetical protein
MHVQIPNELLLRCVPGLPKQKPTAKTTKH